VRKISFEEHVSREHWPIFLKRNSANGDDGEDDYEEIDEYHDQLESVASFLGFRRLSRTIITHSPDLYPGEYCVFYVFK
jgi:hypothetical protein